MLTPQQLETIKEGIEKELTYPVIAEKAGVAKSTIERVNRLYLKTHKFDEAMEKATRQASDNSHANPKASTIRNIQHLRAQGLSGSEVAKRLKVSLSQVYYYQENSKPKAAPSGKQEKLRTKILALREKGLTIRAIAEKLDVPDGTVSYRLYGHGKNGREHIQSKELNSNGASSATNGFNKHVCVGIAFAETERFIGVLSERLGVPTTFLRPRLSELLGHSPIRQSPGNGD